MHVMAHLLVFIRCLEAATIRKEFDESSAKLSKIESRISSLTQKLKHDFGKYYISCTCRSNI